MGAHDRALRKPLKRHEPRPGERHATVRQEIARLLEGQALTARDISVEVGVSERDAYAHMEHIRISAGRSFEMEPPVCNKCGYGFPGRTRLTKPGKCPRCSATTITPPAFFIRKDR